MTNISALADVLKECVESFLAKQQDDAHQQMEDDTQATETEDAGDMQHRPVISLHDTKDLNMKLNKVTQIQQLHLLEQAQLLELLDTLDQLMQQGENLLIEYDSEVCSRTNNTFLTPSPDHTCSSIQG